MSFIFYVKFSLTPWWISFGSVLDYLGLFSDLLSLSLRLAVACFVSLPATTSPLVESSSLWVPLIGEVETGPANLSIIKLLSKTSIFCPMSLPKKVLVVGGTSGEMFEGSRIGIRYVIILSRVAQLHYLRPCTRHSLLRHRTWHRAQSCCSRSYCDNRRTQCDHWCCDSR